MCLGEVYTERGRLCSANLVYNLAEKLRVDKLVADYENYNLIS